MATGFIKNPKILEEDYRVDDLLDFSSIISDFENTLAKLNNNSVIGLIGKFGSGKSTMLYQLYKNKLDESTQKWVHFDAWKYPERKDLWEGFVLDFANQIDRSLFSKIKNKIDGTSKSALKTLVGVVAQGANFFLPGANIIERFSYFLSDSPVKRVFEIQELLNDLIKETDKEIYIIVEDIDRSSDRGLFFLETLRNFIKENSFKKKVIVIVPIGNKYFDEEKDSYLKTLDYQFDFNPVGIGFNKFIRELFVDTFL